MKIAIDLNGVLEIFLVKTDRLYDKFYLDEL